MSYLNIPMAALKDRRILVYRQPSEVPVVFVIFPVVVVVVVIIYLLFSLALQPSAGYGLLVHEVS
jgi:hypothetical protein